MTIDFYYLPGSAPCRAVQMTAKAVGVELNLKLTDLMAGQHMTPEFLKINPQHTIPTLVDNSFALWESRAIMIYLHDKYGKNDSLYPKDPQQRAVVNQRLMFDQGTLYHSCMDHLYALFRKETVTDEHKKKVDTALELLNTFLKDNAYAAGKNLTLADISIFASVTSIEVMGYDLKKYANIHSWYDRVKNTIPGHELNTAGIKEMKEWLNKM